MRSDYKGKISIPEEVTANTGRPYRITSIEDDCFSNLDDLTGINLPNSITSWGEGCFRSYAGYKA